MNTQTRMLLVTLVLSVAVPAHGQTRPVDLSGVSLEDLMNIEITSASRREQKAATTAAAIYVITQDDIQRSGMTTIPELLRLAPGVQVAQINANKWAVSIHGFNDLYANKLIVLVDGRSVYNRAFSGVWWESMDMPIGDIERIEVINGPGGSIWGANAVNGVVNIITKTAAETHGASVGVGAGTYDGTQFSARYSGALGGVNYRVYSQASDYQSSLGSGRVSAGDDWRSFTNGLRLDWTRDANAVTVSSGFTNGRDHSLWTGLDGPTPNVPSFTDRSASAMGNGTISAAWTHTRPNGATLSAQTYLDINKRTDVGAVFRERAADLSLVYHNKLGARHDLVTGIEYRDVNSSTDPTFTLSLGSADSDDELLSVFAQDEIALSDRARLTLGTKVQHHSDTGWGVQPTVRMIWDVAPGRQYLWGAYSRALRTPSLSDLDVRVNYAAFSTGRGLPVLLGLVGNPNYGNEELLMAEVGYRLLVSSTFSVDVTAFQGHYHGLSTLEPLAPVVELTPPPAHLFIATQVQNLLEVDTTGADITAHWTPVSAWRLAASYSGLRITPYPDASSRDAAAARFDGNAPSHQWQVHSTTRLGPRAELTAALYHAGALRERGVEPYTRADLRLEFKATPNLSIIGVGQNLQTPGHVEFTSGAGLTATTIPRSASIHLVWRIK